MDTHRHPAPRKPLSSWRMPRVRLARNRGFTLVEAMVATAVFTLVILGVYSALIQSYKMTALSRYKDEARAVLRTYADQFLRLQTTEPVSGTDYTRWLFNPATSPTGQGLVWGDFSDGPVTDGSAAVSYLTVNLGRTGSQIAARVTREVHYVNAATGATSATRTIASGGYMIEGIFTITFTLSGKSHSQSLTVNRNAP